MENDLSELRLQIDAADDKVLEALAERMKVAKKIGELKKMGVAKIDFCSRSGQINYENVYTVAQNTQIIVNTTPVGMFPEIDNSPIDLAQFKNLYAAAASLVVFLLGAATTHVSFRAQFLCMKQ